MKSHILLVHLETSVSLHRWQDDQQKPRESNEEAGKVERQVVGAGDIAQPTYTNT